MIKRLQKMNFVSAIAFLLSSLCLLFIPFANLTDKLPEYAYFIAAVFWVVLLVGIGLQIYLKSKCKKLKVKSETLRLTETGRFDFILYDARCASQMPLIFNF